MKTVHLCGNGVVRVGNTYMTMGEYKLARKTDPQTSKTAARKLVASGKHKTHCDQVCDVLARFPEGANANEVASKIKGMVPHQVLKRLPDLMRQGRAFKTHIVRDGQTVWRVSQ